MGIVIRQGFKFSVVTYLGVALGAFNILYLFPRFLQPDEIGLRELLVGIAMMLAYFSQLAMNNVMMRFFPYFKDESRQHNGLLVVSLGISLFGFFLIGGLFFAFTPWFTWLFSTRAELLLQYSQVILPLTAIVMVNTLLEQWARLHLRIAQPALFRELFLRVLLTVLVILYGSKRIDFDAFIYGFAASYAFNTLLLIWYTAQLGVLYLQPKYIHIPPALRKEMIWYAAWMLLGGMGVIINERIDGLMLASLTGIKATGIYAVSFFIATIIEMPRRGVSQIAGTLVAEHWKNHDHAALGKLYKQSSLNQLLLGGFLFVGIWSNIDSLFLLIPNGHIYMAGKYVVLFIGISRLLDMANGVNAEIIQNSPYYRFNLISILFLGLISFVTNYLMIPRFGLTGAAAGSTLSMLLFSLLKGGFLWFKLHLQPFEKRTLIVMGVLLLAYVLSLAVPVLGEKPLEIILHMGIRGSIIVLVVTAALWLYPLSDELHQLLHQQAGRLGLRSRINSSAGNDGL